MPARYGDAPRGRVGLEVGSGYRGGLFTWYDARFAATPTGRSGVEAGKVGLGSRAHRKPDAGEVAQLAVRRCWRYRPRTPARIYSLGDGIYAGAYILP
jgi:hypothetical protein